MKCSRESKSSLFSRSHSAVSLRTNLLFSVKKKKNYIPWAFSFQTVTGEQFSPAPRSIYLPLWQIVPDTPFSPLAAPRLRCPLSLPSSPSPASSANPQSCVARTSPWQATKGCRQCLVLASEAPPNEI